jgi:hypothetical protein
MAWVFRKCRHLTPNTALLVILGAVLWLPISFGAATAMHAVLFAKLTSWPAWMQLLHPLATVIAKSKLLVLPVYPAAWPQAKKNSFVQLVVKGYQNIKRLYVIRKVGFRYRQAEIASIAVVERLERTVGIASAVRWLRNAHVAEHFGVEKPTQKLQSFFSRWSIKFSAEYYEAKEQQASDVLSLNTSGRNAASIRIMAARRATSVIKSFIARRLTRGRSPVRSQRTPGSVRGARRNLRPYRDPRPSRQESARCAISPQGLRPYRARLASLQLGIKQNAAT